MADAPPLPTDIAVREPSGDVAPVPGDAPPAPPAPPVDPMDAAVSEVAGGAATPAAEPKPPPVDPLDAAVGEVVDAQKRQDEQQRAFTAYRATHQSTPPEKQLEVLKYAIAGGMDPSVVEDHLDELKKTVDTRALAARLQASPGLAKFMMDASKAPVAKDDSANLSALEWGLTGHWENGHLVTGPAPLRALSDALRQQDYISLANKQAEGRTLSSDEQKQLTELEQQYGGEKDYGAQHLWSKAYLGLFKMAPYLAGDIVARAAGGFAGAAAGTAAGVGAGAAAGAPAAVVGAAPAAAVGGAAGLVGGAGAGQAAGSTIWNFFQNFGPQYRQLKRMTGEDGQPLLSDAEARAYAGTASAVAAGLMSGATGFVLKKLPGVEQLLGKIGADAVSRAMAQSTLRKTLLAAPVKFGANLVAGGVMMAAQAAANSGSAEIAKSAHGQDGSIEPVTAAAADAFTRGLVDMGGLALFGAGREFLHDVGQASALQEQSRRFQAEVEASQQSKLLQRSPELFEQAHRLAQGENTQARYIAVQDWDRYWQQKQVAPGEVASRVFGDGGKAYAEAASTGGELAIPAEKFMSNFANTEHLAGLREDIRLSADSPSIRQAREAFEAKAQEAATPPESADTAEHVKQDWMQKAVAAGEDPKVAEATASLVAASFRNLGKATGTDALDAYRQLAHVDIVRGEGKPRAQEARAAQLSQDELEPANVQALRESYGKLSDEERLHGFFVDPSTGVLNGRAFEQLPGEGQVAHISVEGTKYMNDTAGHEAGDRLYRAAAAALHQVAPEVAKVGGDFLVRVKDRGELDALLQLANESMSDKGFSLTGALGENSKAAGEAHGALKTELEQSGARASRGTKPLGLKGEPKLSDERAKAEVPASLKEAFGKMDKEQAFQAVHREAATGLLTGEGFKALPRKKFVASIDLNGLKAINKAFGEQFGDLFLHAFGRLGAVNGGHEFDMAHDHGDEYLAQHDDRDTLHGFLSKLEDIAGQTKVYDADSDTSEVHVYNGVTFGRGIGETYEEADAALNAHKQQLSVEGRRGPSADAQRIQRLTGQEAQAARNQFRPDSSVVAGNNEGAAGRAAEEGGQGVRPDSEGRGADEAVDGGGTFRLNASGERGYIEFTPPEGGEPRRFDIHLLANADKSTLAHETFHFLSEVMGDVASKADASEQLKADYQTLLTFMGHDSHEARVAAAEERRALAAKTERTPEEEARLKELSGREEKATHAWEQYLAEGKPPSAELAGAFTRFRRWMTSIYRGLAGVAQQFAQSYGKPLELSDDVRGVFDRLLASEDEVQRAQAATEAARPFPAAVEGMTPEERAEYQRVTLDAREKAEDEVRQRIVEGQRKENTAFMQGERERIRGEVESQLDSNPTYRTLRILQGQGEVPELLRGEDGQPMQLERAELVKRYGKDFVASMPRGIFAKKGKGVEAEKLAMLNGWEDADAMVRALQASQPRGQVLASEVQQRMEAQYRPALLDNPQELAGMALDAVHNEDSARKVVLELRALRKLLSKGTSPTDEVLTLETAKSTAARLVGDKTVSSLTGGEEGLAGRYLRAERSAAKRALDAAVGGNIQRAIGEKETQLLNWALYREAKDARAELEKATEKVQSSASPSWRAALGKAHPAIRDANDAILQSVGIRAVDAGQPPPGMDAALQLAATDAQDLPFDVTGIQGLMAEPRPWSALTSDEALNVGDAVKVLKHWANQRTEVELEGKRVSKDALFAEMAERISKRPSQPARPRDAALEGKLADIRKALLSMDAQLMTPDTLVSMLDAAEKDGPFRRALLGPLSAARDTQRDLSGDFSAKLVKAWESLPAELRKGKSELVDLTKDLPLPDDLKKTIGDGPVTRSYLWMLALNMGNDGNKQRLLDGYGWSESQVMKVLNQHLSRAEWNFVQKTWDTLDELYPQIAAVHERATGLRPPKVEATAVQTPFGELRGGYFPAREEPRAKTGPVHHNAESIADMFGEAYRRPAVATGHAKARVEKADYYVNLNWSVVPAHLNQVVHDIAYREPIRQIAALLLDPRFRDMATTYLGDERAKQFVPWLQAVANQSAESVPGNTAGINRVSGWMRNRAMRTALGGNLASMAQHLLDPAIGVAGGVTSAGDTAMANVRAMSGVFFPEMRRFALENSKELQARSDHVARELSRQLREIGEARPGAAMRGLRGLERGAQDFLGVFHESMDKLVTTTTWTAGYTGAMRTAMKEGLSELDAHPHAVKAADEAVRKVYPSAEIAQQSAAIAGRTFMGQALMFQGFANKVWNLQRQSLDRMIVALHDNEAGFASKAGALAKFAGTMMAFAAVGTGAAYLRGQRKKDDETQKQYLERTVSAEPFNTTPLLGPLADSVTNYAVTGKKELPDFRGSPAAEFIKQLADKVESAPNDSRTEEQKTEALIEAVLAMSIAGNGATQLHRSLDYGRQLYTGEAQPRGPLDVAGGLYYGKSTKRPGNPLTDAQGAISE